MGFETAFNPVENIDIQPPRSSRGPEHRARMLKVRGKIL
jgi:hypothetical protein